MFPTLFNTDPNTAGATTVPSWTLWVAFGLVVGIYVGRKL